MASIVVPAFTVASAAARLNAVFSGASEASWEAASMNACFTAASVYTESRK